MKGIILAGGTGSRLYPLTKVTNKHLLPVYDKPMIYYPLQTLSLAEDFADDENVAVILGDNIFQDNVHDAIQSFTAGARIFLKQVPDAARFGVAEVDEERGQVLCIEEKPEAPKSDYAVSGLYLYESGVFDVIKTLKPSGRGELEITDVNNEYIRQGAMGYSVLHGYWSDAGTFESLLQAGVMVEGERGISRDRLT